MLQLTETAPLLSRSRYGSPTPAFTGHYVLIANEDHALVDFLTCTLRDDGHAVFPAYDGLSAVEMAYTLRRCDLILTDTRAEGLPRIELLCQLRQDRPTQPIVYIANLARSSPEIERQLPADVPILRQPFTVEELREVVGRLLQHRRR
jgi:CheY-like chemotaxis protein